MDRHGALLFAAALIACACCMAAGNVGRREVG